MTSVIEAAFDVRVGGDDAGFALRAELTLDAGVLVLFGRSGTGKSLCLQALVGEVAAKVGYFRLGGEALFDTERALDVPTHRRQIGFVPQHHALFPFCNVRDNVTFGLPRAARKEPPAEVVDLMREVGIAKLADAMPERLSGGERQRVALARALSTSPKLLLLDEPFASIDAAGRRELHGVLKGLLARRNLPAVLVTHDVHEARAIGTAVVPFERGRTLPRISPEELGADL